MAEETQSAAAPRAIEKKISNEGGAIQEQQQQPVTPEYVPSALQKLDKPELVQLAAAFFSSKTTFGPDPESAKLMAQTEMHHETCRLEAFKKNLENQEEENKRKHQFRVKRLNHETSLTSLVLVLALVGAGTGLYLIVSDKTGLGSNLLIASVALIYYVIGGKSPFHKKEE